MNTYRVQVNGDTIEFSAINSDVAITAAIKQVCPEPKLGFVVRVSAWLVAGDEHVPITANSYCYAGDVKGWIPRTWVRTATKGDGCDASF